MKTLAQHIARATLAVALFLSPLAVLAQTQLIGNAVIQQTIRYTGDISPTAIAANTNDYAPTGFSTASVVRLSSSAAYEITGLAGGSEGRVVWLTNAGSYTITLKNASSSSTAANRFSLTSDVNLSAGATIQLYYDVISSRWRVSGGTTEGTVTSVGLTDNTGLFTVGGSPITSSGAFTLALATAASGTGGLAKVIGPTFTTPDLGAATATTINGNTITAGSGTLTLAAGKTLTASNTLTLAGTDSSTLNIGTGGTLGTAAYTATGAYEVPLTFSTGLTRTTNTITLNQAVTPTWTNLHTFSAGLASTTLTSSALTSGRITFASTAGLLADDADLTYNSTTNLLTLAGNLTFGTSASVLNGTTGSIGLEATGTNQSITLTPSGTGSVYGPVGTNTNPGFRFFGTNFGSRYDATIGYTFGSTSNWWAVDGNGYLIPESDNQRRVGAATRRVIQAFFGPTGLKIGDGTNGPTITATGSSPNESLVLTAAGTGSVLLPGTSTLKFGATAAATIGVSADTTAGNLTFNMPSGSTGLYNFQSNAVTGFSLDLANGQSIYGNSSVGLYVGRNPNTGECFINSLQNSSASKVTIYTKNALVATFSDTKSLTLTGAYIGSTQVLSGAGAANVTTETTKITTTGAGNAITLADGVDGQTKYIVHAVDGGSFVLTPTTKTGWSTFTSTAAGEQIILKFYTTIGWTVAGSYLGTIAP